MLLIIDPSSPWQNNDLLIRLCTFLYGDRRYYTLVLWYHT